MTEPEQDQDEWIPFSVGHVQCPDCPEEIPVQVYARIELDEEGQKIMNTRADMAEVWAHSWVHDQEGLYGHHQLGPDQGAT